MCFKKLVYFIEFIRFVGLEFFPLFLYYLRFIYNVQALVVPTIPPFLTLVIYIFSSCFLNGWGSLFLLFFSMILLLTLILLLFHFPFYFLIFIIYSALFRQNTYSPLFPKVEAFRFLIFCLLFFLPIKFLHFIFSVFFSNMHSIF